MEEDEGKTGEALYRELDRRGFLKLAAALGGAATLGLPLLGCQPAAAPAPTPTKAPALTPTAAPKPPPVTLKVAGPEVGMYQLAPLDVAEGLGFFAEQGITNDWVQFKGGSDQVRAVTTGGFDLGIVSASAPVVAFAQGEPVRLIAGGWSGVATTWLARADSPLKTLKDLKGKKVGYSRPGAISQTVTMLALKAAGLDPDKDVTLVPTGGMGESWTAVKSGIVDAAWSSETLVSKLVLSGEAKVLGYGYQYIKDWIELVTITNEQVIKEKPDALRRWIQAYLKGLDYLEKNRAEMAKVWAKRVNIPEDIAYQSIKDVSREVLTLKISKAGALALEDVMLELKQITKRVDWNKLYDQQFLPTEMRTTF